MYTARLACKALELSRRDHTFSSSARRGNAKNREATETRFPRELVKSVEQTSHKQTWSSDACPSSLSLFHIRVAMFFPFNKSHHNHLLCHIAMQPRIEPVTFYRDPITGFPLKVRKKLFCSSKQSFFFRRNQPIIAKKANQSSCKIDRLYNRDWWGSSQSRSKLSSRSRLSILCSTGTFST